MATFNKTLTLLNGLIAKLEANTGGQNIQKINTKDSKESKQNKNVMQKKQEKTKKKQKGQKVAEPKVQQTIDKQVVKKEKKQKKDKQKKQKKQQKAGNKQQEIKKEESQQGVEIFAQIDMRIGQIVECWKHPESQKLYCQKISVCGEVRQIASGLQQFVPMQQMKGLVVVMANLKPRPLAKFMSNGMVVCASNADHSDVKIIRPEGHVGQRIYLDGHQDLFKSQGILPLLNPKKKILEKCVEHFKTDEQGFVVWKGIRVRTAAGFLRSQITKGTVS